MRIAVADAPPPFAAPSAADERAEALAQALLAAGHELERIRVPFRWAGDQLAQVTGLRLLELPRTDALVALRFPACALPHPRKLVWLADGPLSGAPHGTRAAERVLLAEAHHVVRARGGDAVAEIVKMLGA